LFSADLAPAVEVRPIFNRKALVGGDDVMCLENQQTTIDHLDGIPNPIVVAIDIKRKKSTSPAQPLSASRSLTFSTVTQPC
jgi:hypothetical protein